ncbi:MAG: hypothetical protein JW808_00940 [Victivallales bacterium]|nr:hypothetical protein [Victivallales bacterium]
MRFIRLVGPKSNGTKCAASDGKSLTQFSVKIPEQWDYAYLEIEDLNGKRAWSNNLFSA